MDRPPGLQNGVIADFPFVEHPPELILDLCFVWFLTDQLGRWKKLLVIPASEDLDLEAFYSKFIDDDVDTELEESTGPLAEEEKDGPALKDERRMILSNLETFQSKLAALVDQCRNSLDSDDAVEADDVDESEYGKGR